LAVTNLGHAHPAVAAAVADQAEHPGAHLQPVPDRAGRRPRGAARRDRRLGRCQRVPCQCGATANEAAIKLARKHGKQQHEDKVRLVALEGSFHGRTLATLEATGQPAKHAPFAPLAGFVDHVPYDDPDALRAAVTDETCAVLLEVVQGEGGVRPVPDAVLIAAREACDAMARC
jgi:acetylornithine/N-succinyldiaminopimelate aminotransferase